MKAETSTAQQLSFDWTELMHSRRLRNYNVLLGLQIVQLVILTLTNVNSLPDLFI